MAKFVSAEEAIEVIKSGDTISSSGFFGMGTADEVIQAIEKKFLETGQPRDLTLTHAAGQDYYGNNYGLNRLGKEGLLKKCISGFFRMEPDIIKLVVENKIEAYTFPMGVVLHLYRAMAGRKPGVVTHVGLKTFADPRETGGKLNDISKEDFVKLVEIDGKEYLFYKSFPVDVAIIRGTSADEDGNISCEKESCLMEIYINALAAKACGGKVIVQVERVAKSGTLHPMMVKVPGTLVDYVVVAKPENHWQAPFVHQYDPSTCGEIRVPFDKSIEPLPMDARKIICRRSIFEFTPGTLVNLGIGVPEGCSSVLDEEGIGDDKLTMSIESGVIGGFALSGPALGSAINAQVILSHQDCFDLYDAGGLDLTILGMAEMDKYGNINVSKFGPRIAGPGGFVNITQGTKTVVFCGTMTAGGAKIAVKDGKVQIINEGKIKKFVDKVEHITFSGELARTSGQKILYVTERAVFELRPEGVTLTEIAPGVDLEKDVLAQMEYKPLIASDLKQMDARIFVDAPMGIKEQILAKVKQ